MMYFGFGFAFLGLIVMIVWWALVVAVVVRVLQWIASQLPEKRHSRSNRAALQILMERYALGKINKKEFDERKKVLESD